MSMEFLKENDVEIIRNLKDPQLFKQDTFEVINLPMNVKAIVGELQFPDLTQQLINPDKKCVQSIKFKKPDWDIDGALLWLRENIKYFKDGQIDKKIYKKDLKSIDGVEIFSAGTWNGDEYTVQDLDDMVKAFNENNEGVKPFLKLGHCDKQELLQNEGLPAAGWVGKIYRKGEKLLADFVDIPQKIYELIENKAYRKVSSEIYCGIKIGEKFYKYMVGAVALLGSETPGVMNLSDILARYGLKDYDSIKTYADSNDEVIIKHYSFDDEKLNQGEIMSKTEKEILLEKELSDLKEKLEAQSEEASKYKADLEAKETELKETAKSKEDLEKKVFEAEEAKKQAEMEKQVDGLVNEKIITKAQRDFALELLKNAPDKETKKYSLTVGEEKKEFDRYEMIKEFAKLGKVMNEVNFEESSEGGKKQDAEDKTEKIEKYAEEKGISFGEAYRQYNAGQLEIEKGHVVEE